MKYEDKKGINLIGSCWTGQTHFYRTVDTSNLEPLPIPFNRFQMWLGRFLRQLGL